jgi:hypothetical protein
MDASVRGAALNSNTSPQSQQERANVHPQNNCAHPCPASPMDFPSMTLLATHNGSPPATLGGRSMGFLILSSYAPKCSDLYHGGRAPRASCASLNIALTCVFVVRAGAFRGSAWTRRRHPTWPVNNYQTILTKMQIIPKGSHLPPSNDRMVVSPQCALYHQVCWFVHRG